MLTTGTRKNIAFLSTYPPRECGLATFTRDLISAIDSIGTFETKVVAVNDFACTCYDNKVVGTIRQSARNDYAETARNLNNSNIDLLIIEHEFGIFGGDYGSYILNLVNNLKIPFVTTLHTILPAPGLKQKFIIKTLGEKSEKIITMARNTRQLLQSVYKVEPGKIEIIHHGVPKKLIQSRESLKKKYGYENKQIISTFGLLSPGKGIEHGIEAISKVEGANGDNKDILYLILGETHPALKEEGTRYRNKLEELVKKLGLDKNIEFINKYLSIDEIIQYLQLSDIYLTPYKGKDQAVSGTLAYAVGYGKAIVSTPYPYAREMLSNGRGLLAEFNSPDSLARHINYILHNPSKKARMERETAKIGRTMFWDKVAQQYTENFLNIMEPSCNARQNASLLINS
jgi:polysaccharide biosynthesis protein PslF